MRSESRRASSYQRRKENIAYLKQRGDELERIVVMLVRQIKSHGIRPVCLLGDGEVKESDYITDISTGDFWMKIESETSCLSPTTTR